MIEEQSESESFTIHVGGVGGGGDAVVTAAGAAAAATISRTVRILIIIDTVSGNAIRILVVWYWQTWTTLNIYWALHCSKTKKKWSRLVSL